MEMILKFLLILAFFKETTQAGIFNRKKLTVIFDKFMVPCPGMENSTISYYNIKMISNKQNGNFLVNYDTRVHEDVNGPIRLSIIIQRCRSKEALDTCAKFSNFNSDRLCQMLEQTSEVWSPFTKCLEPQWKCPIKKGLYHGNNCFLDMDAYNWFPLEGSYWKFQVNFYDARSKKHLMCFIVDGFTKKGIYRGRNCTFDLEAFKWFPAEGSYWKLRAETTDIPAKKIVQCILLDGLAKKIVVN